LDETQAATSHVNRLSQNVGDGLVDDQLQRHEGRSVHSWDALLRPKSGRKPWLHCLADTEVAASSMSLAASFG
jgi:hypothetical protein